MTTTNEGVDLMVINKGFFKVGVQTVTTEQYSLLLFFEFHMIHWKKDHKLCYKKNTLWNHNVTEYKTITIIPSEAQPKNMQIKYNSKISVLIFSCILSIKHEFQIRLKGTSMNRKVCRSSQQIKTNILRCLHDNLPKRYYINACDTLM